METNSSQFYNYSISPKVRQMVLHWSYELTERDFFIKSTHQCIKMSYYHSNKKEILQKAK